jgi:hypothetical protein
LAVTLVLTKGIGNIQVVAGVVGRLLEQVILQEPKVYAGTLVVLATAFKVTTVPGTIFTPVTPFAEEPQPLVFVQETVPPLVGLGPKVNNLVVVPALVVGEKLAVTETPAMGIEKVQIVEVLPAHSPVQPLKVRLDELAVRITEVPTATLAVAGRLLPVVLTAGEQPLVQVTLPTAGVVPVVLAVKVKVGLVGGVLLEL